MITCADREYKATKRIKQGKRRLAAPFDELARWIAATWKVTVLNVIYNRATLVHKPRLQVILEFAKEERKFHRGVNYDEQKQQAIAGKFLEIIAGTEHAFDVEGLFVVFSAFAPLALEEADSQISQRQVAKLKRRLANPDLWKIDRFFGHATFFFYTDVQVQRYEAKGKKAEYARAYFQLLKPHDEFGYLKETVFRVDFDSKQNFDENYQSNWYYYYK
jgi:hypothetical protein